MKTRPLGTTAVQLPEIGLGTWQLESSNRDSCIQALHRGIELGMTHIDTAELYGRGSVEELVGEALQGGLREKVFLASKVMPSNASAQGTVDACERSLKRLRTDHLDLYMLHWAGDIPLSQTLEAFALLKQQGKIRSYGVSNFDAAMLKKAVTLAGPGNIVSNQVVYHLRERKIEKALVQAAQDLGVTLVAFSPLGAGNFPRPPSPGGKLIRDIGQRHNVSAYAVALRFLLRLPGVVTIPRSSQAAHVEELARANDLTLTPEDLSAISTQFTPG